MNLNLFLIVFTIFTSPYATASDFSGMWEKKELKCLDGELVLEKQAIPTKDHIEISKDSKFATLCHENTLVEVCESADAELHDGKLKVTIKNLDYLKNKAANVEYVFNQFSIPYSLRQTGNEIELVRSGQGSFMCSGSGRYERIYTRVFLQM